MNYIFRYLLILCLAVAPFGLSAQNNALLDDLYHTFADQCIVMDCVYLIESDAIPVKGQCEVEFQGTSYKMKGGGLEIFCDGESVWIMDADAMETVIEPVSDDSYSYMSNPALLFSDMDKVFDVKGASANGAGMRYNLSARKPCGVKSAVLDIDKDVVLQKAEFMLDNGSVIKIEVKSVKALPQKDNSAFAPGKISSDWVVTDLR
ncbi:MAG: outer-membrane lipoprotein carrier protein LolA [Bacteroidales bacterium]|nr:outer-membrane lipoprotein carrier protein LolA [Bacteroidales bacterium]